MRYAGAWFVWLFGLVFRRKDNAWVFYINKSHGLSGNARSFLHFLVQSQDVQDLYVVGASSNDMALISDLYPSVKIVKGWMSELFARLACRFVVVTHNPSVSQGFFSYLSDVKIINLWHGIPIKGMGNLDNAYYDKRRKKRFLSFFRTEEDRAIRRLANNQLNDVFVASSVTERALLAGCLFISAEKIKITGMPRLDFLLCESSSLPVDLSRQLNLVDSLTCGRKLVLYAPTFRDDGRFSCGLSVEQLLELSAVCERSGAVLGVRPHPSELKAYHALFAGIPSIVNLGSDCFDVSVVLRKASVLISDYSSIWVDFLVFDRPLVAFLWDQQEYDSARGMMYSFDVIFPGPIVRDYHHLADVLSDILVGGVTVSGCRARIERHFFEHVDCQNAQRVYQASKELLAPGRTRSG